MAHNYMKKCLKDKKQDDKIIVESAGTSAYTGDRATEFAIEVMKKYDTDLTSHRATYIEEADVENADLILCMTLAHKNRIINMYPELASKVYTLKEYVGENIDDPWGYGLGVYTSCAKEIVYYVDKLLKKISRGE